MSKKIKITFYSFLGLFIIVMIGMKISYWAPISWGYGPEIVSNDGLALNGFDAVSYHTSDKPIRGKKVYSYSWKAVNWYFSSEESKQMFIKSPEQYAPQFGGYCAFGASFGWTFPASHDVYTINDNKLFMFLASDAKNDFDKSINKGIILTADNNWLERN